MVGLPKSGTISDSIGVSFSQIVHGRVSGSVSPNPDISSILENADGTGHPIEAVVAVPARVLVKVLLVVRLRTATTLVIRSLSSSSVHSHGFTNQSTLVETK